MGIQATSLLYILRQTACLSIACNATAMLLLDGSSRSGIAETVTLTLSNGDKIKGTLIKSESNEQTTVINHPSLGRLEIQAKALKAKPKKKRWTGSFSAGVTGSNTNQEIDVDGTTQLITQYKDELNLLSFKANAEYGISRSANQKKGSTDTNQGQIDLRYAHTLSGKLSAYASNTYEYDMLNEIGNNNLINSIGLGYDLIKTDTTTLNVSAGPSAQSIWGGPRCTANQYCGNTYAASSARISFDWVPNNYFNLSLSNQFTGAYVDGISPSNNFSGTIKIYPFGDKKLFTSLNGQIIYNSLTTPQIDNSFSLQLGTQLF
ncbi:MAG: hypothetical protein CL860_05415 [Cyanobium sp. MED195]|nr:hypothetical protein [Cyanobium sp. MED195]